MATEPITLPRLGRIVDAVSGRILQSQGCVSQAVKGGISLGVASIVAIEYVFATRQGKLKLLEWEVNGRDVIAPLDNRLFEFVHGSSGSYHTLFTKELGFYQWAAQKNDLLYGINLLSRKNGAGTSLHPNKLNLVLAIEGGHNLSKRFINKLAGVSDPVAVVEQYRKNQLVDFLYLTLTHLSHIPEQLLCSHAYGFKMVKNVPEARPQIKGLTQLGKEVVRACVDTKNNKYPILIDIKHMSLQGRRDFYAYRRHLLEKMPDGFKPPKMLDKKPWWPILATHMGVTGYNSIDMVGLIKEYGVEDDNDLSVRVRLQRQEAAKLPEGLGIEKVYFNPATIGLCDDDIREIARSRGLIGISLDARILGYENLVGRRLPDYDYLSRDDFSQLFPELAKALPRLKPSEEEPREEVKEQEALKVTEGLIHGLADRRKRELYLFCLNVLHVVVVINQMAETERHGINGWDFVCIGSDYDGLIDSLQAADTVEDLAEFEMELQSYLPRAEKAYRKTFEDTPELLPKKNGKPVVNAVLRQLFQENGERFLREWWG